MSLAGACSTRPPAASATRRGGLARHRGLRQALLELGLDLALLVGLGLEGQRLPPLEARLALPAGPPVGVAQMVVDGRRRRARSRPRARGRSPPCRSGRAGSRPSPGCRRCSRRRASARPRASACPWPCRGSRRGRPSCSPDSSGRAAGRAGARAPSAARPRPRASGWCARAPCRGRRTGASRRAWACRGARSPRRRPPRRRRSARRAGRGRPARSRRRSGAGARPPSP